jgi:hypothetical protein
MLFTIHYQKQDYTQMYMHDHHIFPTLIQRSLIQIHNFKMHYKSSLCVHLVISYIMWLYVLSSVLWCPRRNDVLFVFSPSCLREGSCFIYVICVCLCIVVSNSYRVVFCFVVRLVCPVLPVSLYCPFWLPFKYSLTFIYN